MQRLNKVNSDSDGETTDYMKGRKRGPPKRYIEDTEKRRKIQSGSSSSDDAESRSETNLQVRTYYS